MNLQQLRQTIVDVAHGSPDEIQAITYSLEDAYAVLQRLYDQLPWYKKIIFSVKSLLGLLAEFRERVR